MNKKITPAVVGIALSLTGLALAAVPDYKPGQTIEAREGDRWSPVTVEKHEGRKFQIRYSDGTEEWVTTERLRPGSGEASNSTPTTPQDTTPQDTAPASNLSTDGPFTVIRLQSSKRLPRRVAASLTVPPAARPSAAFTDLTPSVDPGLRLIRQMIVCADKPSEIVAVGTNERDDTPLVVFDTANPSAKETRVFTAHEQTILSAAEGGKYLITRPNAFGAPSLHLWEYVNGAYQLRGNYTFANDGSGNESNTRPDTAMLLSPTRLLIQASFGETYLIDLQAKRQVASIKLNSEVAVHCSGRFLMACLESDQVMLRLTDLAIIGQVPGQFAHLSVDPTGTMAAVLEHGTVNVYKLPSKQSLGHINGVPGGKRVDLINADTVLVDGRYLYDVKTGIPVWRYSVGNAQSTMLPNGQIFYVTTEENQTFASMISLPTADAKSALSNEKPDQFSLKPGAHIAIEGDLGTFGDADAARKNLDKAITAAGHKTDATATDYKLTVTSAAGPTDKFTTRLLGVMGPPVYKEVNAPSTIVTLTLTDKGAVIWKREIKFAAGGMVRQRRDESLEQAVAEAAKPNPGQLAGLAVPAYIVQGSDPSKVATLGASKLTRSGFVTATTPADD
ncbi:MAG: tudor domain-containing protein [Tepidisphaeraceae bacterium]